MAIAKCFALYVNAKTVPLYLKTFINSSTEAYNWKEYYFISYDYDYD